MIIVKPRLMLVYVILAVIISIVTNRLTISSQQAMAIPTDKTNVETSE